MTGEAEEAHGLRTAGAVQRNRILGGHTAPRGHGVRPAERGLRTAWSGSGLTTGLAQLSTTRIHDGLEFGLLMLFLNEFIRSPRRRGARRCHSHSFTHLSSPGGGVWGAPGIPPSEIPPSCCEYRNFVFSVQLLIC